MNSLAAISDRNNCGLDALLDSLPQVARRLENRKSRCCFSDSPDVANETLTTCAARSVRLDHRAASQVQRSLEIIGEELIAFRKKHFLPNASLYHKEPIQLVKAQGEYAWDSKGTRYLDAIGGIICISAGHNHPKIKKALISMLEDDAIQHTIMPIARSIKTDIAAWTAVPGRILSVAARFPLYETAAAHKAVEAGGKVGTVVVEPQR